MRLLSPTSKRGRIWWSLWLQDRRRARSAVATLTSSLLVGLRQFYHPAAGLTFCKSWNESEAVPGNPSVGLVAPTAATGSGSYAAGDGLLYQLWAYREGSGQRVYAGVAYQKEVAVSTSGSGCLWPAWTATPGWVTGYAVLRFVNGSYAGFQSITLATMLAGWTDNGGGWSSASALPCAFNNPPVTAKVIWNVFDEYALPEPIAVVASPLGGWAFDATLGDHLARALSDDLRRPVDATMAYWVCPANATNGVLSAVRGIFTENMGGDYTCAGSNLTFGDAAPVTITDHQAGDWYLVVLRRDDLADAYRQDLLRLRDGMPFGTVTTLAGAGSTVLSAASDYFSEGIWGVVAFGSSWHWGLQGYAYFDRMGMWERALEDDEVLDLFNNGLGWQPG